MASQQSPCHDKYASIPIRIIVRIICLSFNSCSVSQQTRSLVDKLLQLPRRDSPVPAILIRMHCSACSCELNGCGVVYAKAATEVSSPSLSCGTVHHYGPLFPVRGARVAHFCKAYPAFANQVNAYCNKRCASKGRRGVRVSSSLGGGRPTPRAMNTVTLRRIGMRIKVPTGVVLHTRRRSRRRAFLSTRMMRLSSQSWVGAACPWTY